MEKDRTVLIIAHNHFDASWRRCFDRPARLHRVTVASYAAVEQAVIDRWLDWDQPFTEGQAAVLRKYLDRRPDRRERLEDLARRGRFACPMTGETVQDTILPAPEGLIRNFLCALPLYREIAGDDHPAYRLVWTEDAFSNSPNYPQIVRGVGADTVCKMSYKIPRDPVWTGLDGSRVAVLEKFFSEMSLGTFEKHPPCPQCRGEGCGDCEGTGLRFAPPIGRDTIVNMLEEAAAREESFMVFNVGGEEILPEEELGRAVEIMEARHPDTAFLLGTTADIYARVKPAIDAALEAAGECEDLEPVFQGCYVSRIRVKQRVRELTYRLTAAESRLATAAFREGADRLPSAELAEAWRHIAFCQFHDVITGTLIDSAYREAMDMLDAAEAIAVRHLPRSPVPAPEPAGPPAGGRVAWGPHVIAFDDCGIRSIETNGRRLAVPRAYGRLRRPLCIGELVVEPDAGDAWATRICPTFNPADNQSMLPLGDFQCVERADDGAIVWKGAYTPETAAAAVQGYDAMIGRLEWTVTLRPGEGGQLLFETAVDWDTRSRRLKVLFPVDAPGLSATYEVPFGHIDRQYDAERVDYHSWSPQYMEYAAQNWVCKTVDDTAGVALLNRGLPCHRWIPGCFELSLLRSPEFHFVGNEPRNYDFNDFDGLRDTGRHTLEYALWPYTDGLTPASLSAAGLAYNRPDGMELPFAVPEGVLVSAWKPAEDGNGCILRFYNPAAHPASGTLAFGRTVRVAACNLLERDEGPAEATDTYAYALRPFEIHSLRLRS